MSGMLMNPFWLGVQGGGGGGGAGGIEFVGGAAITSNSANAFTVSAASFLDETNSPAVIEAGDVMVLARSITSSTTNIADAARNSVPPGFTSLLKEFNTTLNFFLDYARIEDPDFDTFAVDGGGASSVNFGKTIIGMIFRGVDPADPFIASVPFDAPFEALPTQPAITPVVVGSWPIVASGNGGTSIDSANQYNQPSDLSSEVNHFLTAYANNSGDTIAGMGFKRDWISGEFQPEKWTTDVPHNETSNSIAASTAIQPASEAYVPSPSVVEFLGSFTVSDANGGSQPLSNLVSPEGGAVTLQEGDVLIAHHVEVHSTAAVTAADITPTGYTSIQFDQQVNGSYSIASGAFYKVMGATPDTEIVMNTFTTSHYGKGLTVRAYRGVDPSNPIDVSAVAKETSSLVAMPPITPTAAGAMIVACWGGGGNLSLNSSAVALQPINISGWESIFLSNNIDGAIASGNFAFWDSGEIDLGRWTAPANTPCGVGITIALAPA